MQSKIELEFLKSPESFDADYRRVLRHRVNLKIQGLHEEMELLQKCGFSVTENCNGVTEFCNGQQNQKSSNQAAFVEREWAEPDLNRRPLARKANVLTKLDDRPLHLRFSRLDLRCLIKRLQLVHIRIFLLLNLITIRWVETAKVKVEVKMPVTVTVVITKESVEDLDINVGDEVEAIMKKSTEVMIDK